jgi:hypothetical protein
LYSIGFIKGTVLKFFKNVVEYLLNVYLHIYIYIYLICYISFVLMLWSIYLFFLLLLANCCAKNPRSQLRLNQARIITHKITSRFKWFPQCEVRPAAEAITKKFTMKDGVQKYNAEKITQIQNPNTPKSHYYTIEIILKG